MKEILDVIHKTIYQFFDGCGDDEEVPMSDKDKLLLEVNKAICSNLKTLEKETCENKIIDKHYKRGFASGLRTAEWRYDNAIKEIRECLSSLKGSMFSDGLRYALEIISKYRDTNSREAGKIMDKEALMQIADKYMDKIIQEYIDSEFIAVSDIPGREPEALRNAKEDFCASVMDYFKDAKRDALELYPVDKWKLHLDKTDIFDDSCIIADAMVTVGRVSGYDILCHLHLQVVNGTEGHNAVYRFAETKSTSDLQYHFAHAGFFPEGYRENAMCRSVISSERGQAFSTYVKDNMHTAAVLLWEALKKEYPDAYEVVMKCDNLYRDSNGTERRLNPSYDQIVDYANDNEKPEAHDFSRGFKASTETFSGSSSREAHGFSRGFSYLYEAKIEESHNDSFEME